MGLFRKIGNLIRGEELHQDAADELTFHLEARAKEYMRRGMSEREARLAAQRQLGNLTYTAEETASADVVAWLDACRRDLKLAAHVLRKAPVFGTMAALSLALGIGANTMVFTVLKHVVLDSLPVPHPERLVILHNPGPAEGHVSDDGMGSSFSYPLYSDLNHVAGKIFDGIGARYDTTVTLVKTDVISRAHCELVSGNYFNVLGVMPWRGRLLTPDDNRNPGGHPLAVLSYGFWQRNFGGDEHVIGQTVRINTFPYLIVGIAPPRFHGIKMHSSMDIFVPMMMKAQIMPTEDRLFDRLNHWANLVGRLKPGVTMAQAQAQLGVIYPPLRDQDLTVIKSPEPEFLKEFSKNKLELTPGGKGYSDLRNSLQEPLRFLSVMVGIVLLITVVNVANLLIARGAAREREMAVRLSVGAGRGALVRQLLIESLLLGAIGGMLGIALAYVATPALLHMLSSDLSSASINAHPDGFVLLMTALITISAGIAFGLLPALHSARTDMTTAMKAEGGTGHTGGRVWLRRFLVAGQIGFSLLLLTAAMLFTASLWNSSHVNTGLKTAQVVTFKVDPVDAGYSQARIHAFGEELRQKLAALPGVQSVGLANMAVLEGNDWGRNITVPGYTPRSRDEGVLMNAVSPQFFETLGIPIRQGRTFVDSDMATASTVVVVNTAFVKRYFRNNNPVGAHLQFGGGSGNKNPMLTIAGVVADSEHSGLRAKIQPFVYMPYVTMPDLGALTFYIRTRGDENGVMDTIRTAVRKADHALPIYDLKTMDQLIAENLFAERGMAILSVVFAGLAVLLAIVGLYGVVAYSVSRRRREFGIRMAVGADRTRVLGIVMKETALLGLASVACALPIVLATGRLVRSALYGVQPNDPYICSGAALLLFIAAMLAGLIPAASAARTDPHVALRAE
ncbi:MAG TPA: ABC transporter permease [Bryobacteraceae bacterium]|jgi:predicted permease|nr:ABC transporter permease [Bryobacteraceae bacterium]